MSDTDSDGTEQEEIDQSVSESLREELEAQEPGEEKKGELREEHEGHLVRDTTSKLALESPEIGPGIEVNAKAEIPDTYCFTCGEWIGLSGVELRGTPRSHSEAYYLGGMPTDVLQAKNGTDKTLNELADRLIDCVEIIEDRDDAFQFIETEIQELRSIEAETEQGKK